MASQGSENRIRRLGRYGGVVPVIGQGTWNMERDNRREVLRAIRRGIDLGLTHIDTAEMYGAGKVERLLAEALAGKRSEVYLASKVLPQNASYQGTIAACEASLKRLGTDYLDLYLQHWPGNHPLEETFRAFETLSEAGKIRAYGVSNFDAREIGKAVALAGEGRIACNQVLYHLEERGIEHEILPACEKHQISVVAYSPFGSGHFPSPRSRGGRVLADLARERGATPRQMALAFLTARESVVTIPKASSVDHVEENAGAFGLNLSEAELRLLDAAFPRGPRRSGVPML